MPASPPKRENLLVNLACNLLIPTLVLSKLSAQDRLGPAPALVLALAFPLGYGIYDFAQRRRTNFISLMGFFSILLTGGLGLMKAPASWLAVKEAAVPLVISAVVLLSMRSKTPIVRELFYNEQVIDVPRVSAALVAGRRERDFDRLIASASYFLAISFVISSILNFILARLILKSPPDTPEFNQELARLNLVSWPVIALPGMIMMMVAFWRLVRGLQSITGLTFDEIFRGSK